ncbi:hypothetical protein [Planctomyces sp. SH-PL14]|uniref:hypothetical protein n=1 Tax=Planctomyces sp. SH-PL14 TaxID=1632864 RepID=UPI00078DF1CB|nr:hypothetical protein [Planctomyces sp. SH-PL14]AMV20003.1 hypothetical protein VT03_19045 [Planctomyces sp. SH-PL14]
MNQFIRRQCCPGVHSNLGLMGMLVEPRATRIILAHPGELRIIALLTRKFDHLDARSWPKCSPDATAGALTRSAEFELDAQSLLAQSWQQ